MYASRRPAFVCVQMHHDALVSYTDSIVQRDVFVFRFLFVRLVRGVEAHPRRTAHLGSLGLKRTLSCRSLMGDEREHVCVRTCRIISAGLGVHVIRC